MREILFRGKSQYTGRWGESVCPLGMMRSGHLCNDFIPETVWQFTGLTDKNGKKVFEGDMIKPFDDEIDRMVVEFHHGQFLLCLYGERGYMAEYGWEESGNYGCFEAEPLSSYGNDIEVIGNIHDNPELMEV